MTPSKPDYADVSGDTIHDYADIMGCTHKEGNPILSSLFLKN